MNIKDCEYRNCDNIISGRKSNAKYCSNKCKENERTYLKRERRKDRLNKQHIVNLLIDSGKNKFVIDLYLKLYK